MLDDFITKVQVEELHDESHLKYLPEYYEWINEQNKLEVGQSGRESIREDSLVWEQECKSGLSFKESI